MKKIVLFLFAIVYSNISFGQENVVKFQADIANRNGDVIYIKSDKTIIKEIKAEADGHFSSSFEVKEGKYLLYDGLEYTELYLKNGYDLDLKMDAQNFDESIIYSGKGSLENNYLAQKVVAEGAFNFDELLAMTPQDFAKKISEKQSEDIKELEKGGYDQRFVEIQKKGIEQEAAELTNYFKQKQEMQKMNNSQSPLFDYVNYAGGKTKLTDLKGKYVYIDVWATWCGPCRGEIPSLQKVEEKYKDKKIAFISISVDVQKDFEKWKKFVADKTLGGIQLFADKDWNSDFIRAFGIDSIPRFILIDPTGKVVNADAPRPSDSKLQVLFDSLLK